MTKSIEILYISDDAVIVNKPIGMPTQSDPTKDPDLMTETAAMLSEQGLMPKLWLVHRLDRNVGGAVVFARNKKSAAELSALVAGGGIGKRYFAVCDGAAAAGEYRDMLYKDSATGKAYVVSGARKGAKEAVLYSEPLCEREGKTLVRVELETGRFHQIRAQFSARGNSLVGDKKYGNRDNRAKTPALFAYCLSFKLSGKEISARVAPRADEYPWSLFDKKYYESEEF